MAKIRARARGAHPDGATGTTGQEPWVRLGKFDWLADLVATPEGRRDLEVERLLLEATENLAVLMQERGVTRRELARRLRVSPARVSQMLDGTRNLTLASLAEAFHVLGRSMHVTYGPLTDQVEIHAEKKKRRARRAPRSSKR